MVYYVICINDYPHEVTTDPGIAEERRGQLQKEADRLAALNVGPHTQQYVWISNCPEAKLEE
jgi:hypothetical protein